MQFAYQSLANIVSKQLWLRFLWRPIAANGRFFSFMYLLGAVCIWTVNAFGKVRGMFELYAELYLLCVLLLLCPRCVRRWARGLLAVVLYVLAVVDLFCYSRFGSGITPMLLTDVVNTNVREATEALRSFVTLRSLLSPVLLVFLVAGLHLWWVWRKPRLPRCRLSQQLLGALCGAAFLACSVSSLTNWRFFEWNFFEADTELEMQYGWQHEYVTGFYLPVYRLIQAARNVEINMRSIRVLESKADAVSVDSCSYRSPNIVLIIGESYNRRHAQLYGYFLPTTPLQQKLAADSSLVAFTDVIAPYNQTSEVFRLMFSLYGQGCKRRWEDYPLFPQLFRRAGYNVDFITNQFVMSPHLDIWDYNGSTILNSPKLSRSQFSHRNTRFRRYDQGLLHDYDSLQRYDTRYNLIIFHLLGQHFNYADRFPSAFARFRPKDYRRPDLTPAELKLLADYDNATLYNDYVVNAIVSRFAGRDAVVIYVPDHGELVFDDSRTFGRTFDIKNWNEAHQQLEVPFWIYATPIYRHRHPEVWQQVWKARKQPFMTDNLDQMLLYLAGIRCADYRPQDNPLEPVYRPRKRIAEEGWRYDR